MRSNSSRASRRGWLSEIRPRCESSWTGAGTPGTAQPATSAAPAPTPAQDDSHLGRISLNQPLREARDEFERIYFEYHLLHENHSMTRVSERTGLERTHLYRKLKQLGIDTSRKKSAAS